MIEEREVSGKIISTDDACNWKFIVEDIKDYDHVYVNGIRYTEFQPKREPLSYGITANMFHANKKATNAVCYWAGVYDAEKAHKIGE